MAAEAHQNQNALRVFRKAQLLSYWSLSGIIVPLAGIILGTISLSTVSVLAPSTDDELLAVQRIRRFSWAGIGISVMMTIVAAVGLVLLFTHHTLSATNLSGGNGSNTVTGTLSLHDDQLFGADQSGSACQGSGGYDDIAEGAQVVASDGSGKVLAVSQLDAGKADGSGSCVFSFTINNVPYSNFYQLEVSHRGELDYSYQQLSASNFNIATTLGN